MPNQISSGDATAGKLSGEIAKKSWQRKWDEDSKGKYTYCLISCVWTKVTFPKERDIGISYCRILLHDILLNEDGYRT